MISISDVSTCVEFFDLARTTKALFHDCQLDNFVDLAFSLEQTELNIAWPTNFIIS